MEDETWMDAWILMKWASMMTITMMMMMTMMVTV